MKKTPKTSKKKPSKPPQAKPQAKGQGPGAQPKGGAPTADELDGFRRQIDRLDARLIKLLNERAAVVKQVGLYKQKTGAPIYAPHRDVEVVDRVLRSNAGPLLNRSVEAVYREIMSASFALERPLRIGFLGPPGSFSHAAAVRHFGSSVEHDDLHTIDGVFTEVRRGHVDYGLVPIENSIGGGITETLDAFRDSGGEVTIYAELLIEVHHALLANCEPAHVSRIHSKPEVFQQCRHWLATQYPKAELVPAASSAQGAKTAAEEYKIAQSVGASSGAAAVGSALAGRIYGLNVLFERIEDNPSNMTRFLVISKQQTQRSGDDKTSIMFTTEDKPGALVAVLSVFDRAGVNLTHIDKRPSRRMNWDYTFFIDAAGHRSEGKFQSVIEEAKRHCRELTVLGSYPRAKRIL